MQCPLPEYPAPLAFDGRALEPDMPGLSLLTLEAFTWDGTTRAG